MHIYCWCVRQYSQYRSQPMANNIKKVCSWYWNKHFQFPTRKRFWHWKRMKVKYFCLPDKYAVVHAVTCKTTEFGVHEALITKKQAGSLRHGLSDMHNRKYTSDNSDIAVILRESCPMAMIKHGIQENKT